MLLESIYMYISPPPDVLHVYRGGGRVSTVSRVVLNFTDGSFNMTKHFTLLDEPEIVTGGVLLSNGHCTVVDSAMSVTISIRNSSVEDIGK